MRLNKKPAIGWQSRAFWESLNIALAIPSREASAAGLAMPHGRLSEGSQPAQANGHLIHHLSRQ